MNIYSITDGMKRIDVPENGQKNNLPIGTIVKLNGYSDPEYVIVKNMGINPMFTSYGSAYLMVDLETKTFSRKNAYELRYIAEKKDNRIQSYITDKILSPSETLEYYQAAEQAEKNKRDTNARLQAERDQLIAQGKELFKKYIPESAQALILAVHEIDESDIMTDYFHISKGETVILGWSSHKRDLFSEMRKYAHLIPETAHLAELKKENEHREKYSMGRGYYLKNSHSYSSGWTISKRNKYNGWPDDLYVSIAKRCVFNQAA